MPKRKYTDAERAAMGRSSSKRKRESYREPVRYDDEDRGRRGAEWGRESGSDSSGGGLLLAGLVILLAMAFLMR